MADMHTWQDQPTSDEVMLMEERMRLFIFPNQPSTQDEIRAFKMAVAHQIVHEKSRQEQAEDIPEGVSSFRIGDFSMTFEPGMNGSGLTRKTICPAAYSVLLRAGLLYRGLEGRC